jgi:hypothetical protein
MCVIPICNPRSPPGIPSTALGGAPERSVLESLAMANPGDAEHPPLRLAMIGYGLASAVCHAPLLCATPPAVARCLRMDAARSCICDPDGVQR